MDKTQAHRPHVVFDPINDGKAFDEVVIWVFMKMEEDLWERVLGRIEETFKKYPQLKDTVERTRRTMCDLIVEEVRRTYSESSKA